MKKSFIIGLLIILNSNSIYSQNPLITDNKFSLLTNFTKLNESHVSVYYLALGRYKEGLINSYCLFLENVLVDFSAELSDTTGVSMIVRTSESKKLGSISYSDEDRFELKRIPFVPKSNTKGVLMVFYLPDSLAFDCKNHPIGVTLYSHYKLHPENKYSNDWSSSSIVVGSSNLFINNAYLITSKKGSFYDLTQYKQNKILLYSLFLKDHNYIIQKLGNPIKIDSTKKDNIIAVYDTKLFTYEITYQGNKSNIIVLYPKFKFKYIGRSFFASDSPFEIKTTPMNEYSFDEVGSSGEDADFGYKYTFRDQVSHVIDFYKKERFLDKVIVKFW